jgi:hypothetical protein
MDVMSLLLLAAVVGLVIGAIVSLFTGTDFGEAAGVGAAFVIGLLLLYPLYLIVLDIIQRIW